MHPQAPRPSRRASPLDGTFTATLTFDRPEVPALRIEDLRLDGLSGERIKRAAEQHTAAHLHLGARSVFATPRDPLPANANATDSELILRDRSGAIITTATVSLAVSTEVD